MAINAMPAIDQRTCGAWTENDVNLYQHLDRYLDKVQVDRKQWYPTFDRIITKKRKWKAGMGPVMRVVKTNPSPDLRQFAYPKPISTGLPLVDVMNVTESYTDVQVCSHQFESPHFSFYPDFNDFLTHVDDNGKDIMEKIELFNEKYLRGMMFHMSPYAFVCRNDGSAQLVASPYWLGTGTFSEGNDGKSTAFLQALFTAGVADISGAVAKPDGGLSLTAIEQIMTTTETDLGVPFFDGSDLPKDDQPLSGKFLWVLDSEAWNGFVHDPFVQGNRPLNFDIITNGYRGSFFGRATARLEQRPLRFKLDGTYVAPQIRVANAAGVYNDKETEPNPVYTGLGATQSPIGVAWIIGKNNYESVEVGPPPAMFTGEKFPDAPGMQWNAEVRLTKNFLIPCTDADGNVYWQANTYGKFLKFISEGTFGIVPNQRRNAIPVFYQRRRGPVGVGK